MKWKKESVKIKTAMPFGEYQSIILKNIALIFVSQYVKIHLITIMRFAVDR